MNILREVRRVNKKSMPLRLVLLFTFCVIFIVTTYAWFSAQKDVNLGGLTGDVTSWDVSYFINENTKETLDHVVTFTIDELYPGMPNREDLVHIYNIGEASTNITYELVSVKVFGEEIVDEIDIGVSQSGTARTTTIFSGDTNYPFVISYTYDKSYLNGKYAVDDPVTSQTAHATFRYNLSWAYEGNGTDAENLAKDTLDTQFGKNAYEYYNTPGNDISKAIEIQVKITSKMIHPNLES